MVFFPPLVEFLATFLFVFGHLAVQLFCKFFIFFFGNAYNLSNLFKGQMKQSFVLKASSMREIIPQ